jgi:hypothetical protein
MTPTKRKIVKHGKDRWEVDYGLDEHRKKKRNLVKTEAEADKLIEAYEKGIKKQGDWWTRLTPLERGSIQQVVTEIESKKLILGNVWAKYQEWANAKVAESNVVETEYSKAVDEFSEIKKATGKSDRYVDEVVGILKRFGEGQEKRFIHLIQPTELETWIHAQKNWGKKSKATNLTRFSSLWTVAVNKGWCTYNIVDRVEPISAPSPEVRIYSNDTVCNLLGAVLHSELTKPVLVEFILGFFGCMRPEEVQSVKALRNGDKPFGWNDIDLDHARITVRPEVAKKGDQRTIRLQPAAVEWLKLAKKLGNPLPPVNERKLTDACCDLIGFTDWIRDGLRKNCATHLRNVHKNDYEVTKDMGNSVRVLLNHYTALRITEEESNEYWKITPARVIDRSQSDTFKALINKGLYPPPESREKRKQS